MKSKFFLLAFLPVIISLHGCCLSGKKDVKIRFTDEQREWMIYSLQDTLKFASQDGNTDLFVVTAVENEMLPIHQKFRSDCENKEVESYYTTFTKYPQDSDYRNYSISLHNDSFGSTIEWYGFTYTGFHNLPLQAFTIDGQTFNDVWQYTITNQYTGNFIKLSYSKSIGMLEYEYADGRKFTRILN